MNNLASIFRRLQVKQANMCRRGRTLGQKAASVPDPLADRANESHVASTHSDSIGADRPIPRGIAILIDILAHEALKDVIAEHSRKEARDDGRQEATQSGKPTSETTIGGPGAIKTKSCPEQDSRQTDLFQQNQIDIKIKSVLLVAGVGFEPTTFGL
jgi:hypothetical protein